MTARPPAASLLAALALGLAAASAAAERMPLQRADVRVEVRADRPLAAQRWGNLQCDGRILPPAAVPPEGLHGRALPGGQTLRFGRVPDPADPADPSSRALRFTLDMDDAVTADSYRCELALGADAARGLPLGTAFWHAFDVWLPDLDGTDDDQAIAQWHAGDGSGLLPIYTLLLRGRELRIVLRHDLSPAPSRATTQAGAVWRSMAWAPRQWLRIVTHARLPAGPADGGSFRAWLDGTPIVDHAGPVGYGHASGQPYAKHGVYHWIDAGNRWHPAAPTRTVHLRRALLVADPTGRYGPADLDAALSTR